MFLNDNKILINDSTESTVIQYLDSMWKKIKNTKFVFKMLIESWMSHIWQDVKTVDTIKWNKIGKNWKHQFWNKS